MAKRSEANGTRVTICQDLGAKSLSLFEKTLLDGGFWDSLLAAHRASHLHRDLFRIIIKPDIDCYDTGPTLGTDPALVERLIDLLHDRGFSRVVVGDGRNDETAWLHNREPLVLPDLVGYRFRTTKGLDYRIVDLNCASATPEPGAGSPISISDEWRNANYRINFAKNRTHEDCFYALCVRNLIGVAATRNGPANAAEDQCLEVLRHAPPHFNLIDAFVSAHGGAGQRAARAIDTHAFVASTDALLADWAGAAKMGVDPYLSPVNATALRAIGLPRRYVIDGDLAPYRLWRNVHPLIAHSARSRNQSHLAGQLSAAWFQSVDRERFPLKDFYNDRMNAFLTPLVREVDENSRSFAAVVLANYALAKADQWVLAQHTIFAKDKLERRRAPLTIDPASFDRRAYESIPEYLAPYERLVESTPPGANNIRWRHVDGSVLFLCSHVLPIPFDDFVGKVDIAGAIRYLNDYLGGSTWPILRDERGRIARQAERNLYLQQPNWLALFGGQLIDVEKLEVIRYRRDRHTIHWRTVHSANNSADCDDGCVSFSRSNRGRATTVRVFSKQRFALPLLFRVCDVNKLPGLRDPIIASAYATFFAGTIANLEAAYAGKEFRIGRDVVGAAEARQQDLPRFLATALAALVELIRHRGDLAEIGEVLFTSQPATTPQKPTRQADENGFVHFSGIPAGKTYGVTRDDAVALVSGVAKWVSDAPEIWSGLAAAARDDLDHLRASMGG